MYNSIASFVLTCLGYNSLSAPPDLMTLRASLSTSAGLIQSIEAEGQFSFPPDERSTKRISGWECRKFAYRRQNGVVRIREESLLQVKEYCIANGVSRMLSAIWPDGKGRAQFSGGNRVFTKGMPNSDLYELCCLNVNYVPLDRFLEKVGLNWTIRSENTLVRLEATDQDKTAYEITLDGATNFQPRSIRMTFSNSYVLERRVVEFSEIIPGVFFPSEVKLINDPQKPNTIPFVRFVKIKYKRVNSPIPDHEMTLIYPDGTIIVDEIEGVSYPVDSGGKPIGPRQPLVPLAPQNVPFDPDREKEAKMISRSAIAVATIGTIILLVTWWKKSRIAAK